MVGVKPLTLIAVCSSLANCASYDRVAVTSFIPTSGDAGFKFRGPADTVYPLDSPAAETQRMTMIDEWLRQNGMCARGYDVVSRQVVKRTDLIADVWYEGKCVI